MSELELSGRPETPDAATIRSILVTWINGMTDDELIAWYHMTATAADLDMGVMTMAELADDAGLIMPE